MQYAHPSTTTSKTQLNYRTTIIQNCLKSSPEQVVVTFILLFSSYLCGPQQGIGNSWPCPAFPRKPLSQHTYWTALDHIRAQPSHLHEWYTKWENPVGTRVPLKWFLIHGVSTCKAAPSLWSQLIGLRVNPHHNDIPIIKGQLQQDGAHSPPHRGYTWNAWLGRLHHCALKDTCYIRPL